MTHPLIQHARGLAALELRNAAALRRDLALGILPRRPALFAHRDCIRHARACTIAAQIVGRLA